MPRIKEYFAPDKRIAPSEKGFEAAQALARSQEALGSSGERTAEAWVQAARRLGTLGTEKAQMVAQSARLRGQAIEGLRNVGHVEGERPEGVPRLPQQHQQKKPQQDSAREVLRAAAATFSDGTKYPVDPNTGQPFSAQSWELYQRTRQLNEEEGTAATQAAEHLPINPATGAPFTRASWQNAQWQRQYDQQQYSDQREAHTLTQQQISAQRQADIEKATGISATQQAINEAKERVDKFNQFEGRQDPTKPDQTLPIDPRTQTADNPRGTPFTPQDWKLYNNTTSFANKQNQNASETGAPGAPVLTAPTATDAGTDDTGVVQWGLTKAAALANTTASGMNTISDPGNVTLGNQAVQSTDASASPANPAPNPADNVAAPTTTSGQPDYLNALGNQ